MLARIALRRVAPCSLLITFLALSGCATIPTEVATYRQTLRHESVDGLDMAYFEAGPVSGQTIVLLHGLPTSSYLYRNVAKVLGERGYHVIVPDLIGYGASAKPSDTAQLAFARQAERLNLLFNRLHVSHATFVVHDMGGIVGWELLSAHPQLFDRLLILNTTAYQRGFNPPPEMKQLAGSMGGMMSFMMQGQLLGPKLTRKFFRQFTAHPERLTKADINQYWWPIHEGTTRSMRYMARNFNTLIAEFPRYQTALKNFKGPTRILWGTQDKVLEFGTIAPQFARDLETPPDRIQAVEDSGHFIQEDHPEAVVRAIETLMQAPIDR